MIEETATQIYDRKDTEEIQKFKNTLDQVITKIAYEEVQPRPEKDRTAHLISANEE